MQINNYPLIFNANTYGDGINNNVQLYGQDVMKKDFEFQRLVLYDDLENNKGTKIILEILPVIKNKNILYIFVETTKLPITIMQQRSNLATIFNTSEYEKKYEKHQLEQYSSVIKFESSVLNFEEGRKLYNERYQNILTSTINTLILNGLRKLLDVKMSNKMFKLYIDVKNDEQYLISYLNNEFACTVKNGFRVLLEKAKSNIRSSTSTAEQTKMKDFVCVSTSNLLELLANLENEKTYSISGDEANKNIKNGRVLEIAGVKMHAIDKMLLDDYNDIGKLFDRLNTMRGVYSFFETSKMLGKKNPYITIFDMDHDKYKNIKITTLLKNACLVKKNFNKDVHKDSVVGDYFDISDIYTKNNEEGPLKYNITMDKEEHAKPKNAKTMSYKYVSDRLLNIPKKFMKDFVSTFESLLVKKMGQLDCLEILNKVSAQIVGSINLLAGVYPTFLTNYGVVLTGAINKSHLLGRNISKTKLSKIYDSTNVNTFDAAVNSLFDDGINPTTLLITYEQINLLKSIDLNDPDSYRDFYTIRPIYLKFLEIVDCLYEIFISIYTVDWDGYFDGPLADYGSAKNKFMHIFILGDNIIDKYHKPIIFEEKGALSIVSKDISAVLKYKEPLGYKIFEDFMNKLPLTPLHLKGLLKNGLPVPVSFLLFRKNITFNTQIVSATVTGGIVGNSYIGFEDIVKSQDGSRMENMVVVNAGLQNVLIQPNTVHNFNNVLVKYISGMGTTFKKENTKEGDIICVAVKYNETKKIAKHISVLGSFGSLFDRIVENRSKIRQNEHKIPHYSSSDYYNSIFDFKHDNLMLKEQTFDDIIGENMYQDNNIVSLETFLHPTPDDDKNAIVYGDSVFGNLYPGCKAIFNQTKMQQMDNKFIHQIFPKANLFTY